jgi:hypothetical protein
MENPEYLMIHIENGLTKFLRRSQMRKRKNQSIIKPFIKRKYFKKIIVNWKNLKEVIKKSDYYDFEIIKSNKQKRSGKYDLRENSIIINNAKNFFDFNFMKEWVDKNKYFTYVKWNVHIYASYNKKSSSFNKHFDYAHNFIVPQQGKSRWILDDFCDTILEPGDLLYIPYEWKHECIPLEKRISLSFPFWPEESPSL